MRLGVTLYSLTSEYRAGKYNLEEMLALAGGLGVGPGIEIVGFQSIRTFPDVPDQFALRFRRLLDDAGLEPTCLGANVDIGRRRDRHMTDSETVEYLSAQIRAAAKLGFPVMRIQFGARPDALRAVAPVAESAGVRLGMEIHAPHSVDHPTVVALRELYEEIDSAYLGFIPDFGASARAIPVGAIRQQRELGTSDEIIDLITSAWTAAHAGKLDPFVARRDLLEEMRERGAGPEATAFAWRALTLWGGQSPQRWTEIMPRVVHVHGKFFDIDENGDEPSVPYAELMRVFGEAGYDGTISSEWEGSAWAEPPDGFAMVREHQAMMRRYLSPYGNEQKRNA